MKQEAKKGDEQRRGGGAGQGGEGGRGGGEGGKRKGSSDDAGCLGGAASPRVPPPKSWRWEGVRLPGKGWRLDRKGFADVLGLNDSSYDWGWLCKPRSPWSAPGPPPPFFGNDEALPWIVAVAMGMQHAISMLASIVTVPLFIGGPFNARLTQEDQQYLIAAGMIYAGFGSLIQVHRFRLPNGFFLGTGLICVIGTSFTFVPIATAGIQFMMREDTDRVCDVDAECTPAWAGQAPPYIGVSIPGVTNIGQCNTETHRCRASGQEAYGRILGTCLLGSFLEVALSFTPKRILRRIIPHSVTGICVTLIGVGLTGTGMMYWGGGILCANNVHKRVSVVRGPDLSGNVTGAIYPSKSPCASGACGHGGALWGTCRYKGPVYDAERDVTVGDVTECEAFADLPGVAPAKDSPNDSWIMCGGNGKVSLPFGSPQYVALGGSVIVYIIILEVFGSPFARNCSVAISLFLGFLTAAIFSYVPPEGGEHLSYISLERVAQAPSLTFLWARTFPLGVYFPALFPVMVCYVITTVESIGDITASCEASGLETEGEVFDSRLQGGLLADGVNSFLSCLCTSMPNTTFSQNNGVISLTRCASRRAGYCCCVWMCIFGILAKLSALITSVPDCVLGGMVTFLFANITVSGIRILGQHDVSSPSLPISIFRSPYTQISRQKHRAKTKNWPEDSQKTKVKWGHVENFCTRGYFSHLLTPQSTASHACPAPQASTHCTLNRCNVGTRSSPAPRRTSERNGACMWPQMDRKDRIIVASGLALGVGVAIAPSWATNALFPATPGETGTGRLLRESAIITLSSPYSLGTLMAVLLNAVIPRDAKEASREEGEDAALVEAAA